MALIDKLHGGDKVSAHAFSAALRLWLGGDATRAQVVSLFNLLPEDETGLDEIQGTFDAQNNATAKIAFLLKLEGIIVLLQEGLITEAQAKTLFGMQ